MKPTSFSIHVKTFLTHYLAAQRNVSPNTIKAYRDVFTLLLRFCRDVQGIALERLRLAACRREKSKKMASLPARREFRS
jgi:integrase/recombinase XerD